MNHTITTPGKLNLYLKVTRRRVDGYHELNTLFIPVNSVNDCVTLNDADKLSVSSSNMNLPRNKNNICYQAAMAYANAAKIKPNWHIHIEKRIPVAAGMGGGSSDAAAVLRMLQQYYHALDDNQMNDIALSIGADVPFFLNPCLARGQGVGEQLTPIAEDYPPLPLLILYPRFPVSAAWAYNNLHPGHISPSPSGAIDNLLAAWKSSSFYDMAKLLHNDLGFALYHKFPLLENIRDRLLDYGACGVEISGSGPTLFAIFENQQALNTAAEFFTNEYRGVADVKSG